MTASYELGRGGIKFFNESLKKKKNLQEARELVVNFTSIDQVDSLEVPTWTKRHFKEIYKREVLKMPTAAEIAAIMAAMHVAKPDPQHDVYAYTGDTITIGTSFKVEVEYGDLFAIISPYEIKLNRYTVKMNQTEFDKLYPNFKVGAMSISEYMIKVGDMLNQKYDGCEVILSIEN